MRMLTFSRMTMTLSPPLMEISPTWMPQLSHLAAARDSLPSSVQPHAQRRKELFRVHGFREVLGSARFQALLTIAFHRLGGQSNNGQPAEGWVLPDHLHGFVSIHFRHHDIHHHTTQVASP